MNADDTAGGRERGLFEHPLEVFAVILLSLGTLGSAWSVFQAARWNNVQTDKLNESTVARIESSKETTLATARIVYDATMISQYAFAVSEGRVELQRFYREKLFRPAFVTMLDQW